MKKTRIKELGDALIDYLKDTGVRMSRSEVDDFLSRGVMKPTAAEIDETLADVCARKRVVRVGTIKSTVDRDDGLYCLPSKMEASAVVEGAIKASSRSRYSIARGAPSSDLTHSKRSNAIVESNGGWDQSRKPAGE